LAFGIHNEIDASDSTGSYYCIGFRDTELGDNAVCTWTGGSPFYYWANEGYTITDSWFASTVENYWKSYASYSGFSERGFKFNYDFGFVDGDVQHMNGFRFLGAQENDGLRWTSGDSIDLFALDFEAEVLIDNEGFVLGGAA
jgi:hypothetical protein